MSYKIASPSVTREGVLNLRSYLLELADDLTYIINDLDRRTGENASKIDLVPQTPNDTFESIKELIGHSPYLQSVFGGGGGSSGLIWKSYTILTSQWTESGGVYSFTQADPDMRVTSNVVASPAPSSMASAVDNGVYVSAAAYLGITFTARTLPSVDITMNYAIAN